MVKGGVVLLLLVLSLFNYSREIRHQTVNGSSVETVRIDGAALVTIGLGIAAIFSVRAFFREIKRLSIRLGLPEKLPSVRYEWLPLAVAPFLLVGYSYTRTIPAADGTAVITSGFGDSSVKLVVLVMLCGLIYLAKLRGRLKAIDGAMDGMLRRPE
jgi:putative copper export protein